MRHGFLLPCMGQRQRTNISRFKARCAIKPRGPQRLRRSIVNLEELLEHIGAYLDDRHDLVDGDPDELWSDALIVRFLNQAQRIHARRAWSIVDKGHATA